MFKKILIITIVIFTLFSCSIDDGDSNFSIETLTIKEAVVPAEFVFGQTYTLKVIYDLPSSCHSFSDLFYQKNGTARIIAVNSLVNNGSLDCAQVLIEREYSFEVNILQSEDYIFKFWKGIDTNGDDIFEEVIVPVN